MIQGSSSDPWVSELGNNMAPRNSHFLRFYSSLSAMTFDYSTVCRWACSVKSNKLEFMWIWTPHQKYSHFSEFVVFKWFTRVLVALIPTLLGRVDQINTFATSDKIIPFWAPFWLHRPILYECGTGLHLATFWDQELYFIQQQRMKQNLGRNSIDCCKDLGSYQSLVLIWCCFRAASCPTAF